MAQGNALREQPSMEDILSSIRKIIEDGEEQIQGQSSEPSAAPIANSKPAESVAPVAQAEPVETPSVAPVASTAPAEAAPPPKAPVGQMKPQQAATPASHGSSKEPMSMQDLEDFVTSIDERAETTSGDDAASSAPLAAAVEQAPTSLAEAASALQENAPEAEADQGFVMDELIDAVEPVDMESAEATVTEEKRSTQVAVRTSEPEEVPAIERRARKRGGPALSSEETSTSVAASLRELNSVLVEKSGHDVTGVAEDILRPMLSEWLDNNLPSMVERLVREEIERIARGD